MGNHGENRGGKMGDVMDTESPNVVMKHGKSLWQHRGSWSLVGGKVIEGWISSTIPSGNL